MKRISRFGYGKGYINAQGYRVVYRPEWHNADNRGYVRWHRYKFELMNGIRLQEGDVVHHINGNKLDNMLSNLTLMSKREHDAHEGTVTAKKYKRAIRQLFMLKNYRLIELAKMFNLDRNVVARYVQDLVITRKKMVMRKYFKLRMRGFTTKNALKVIGVCPATISLYVKTFNGGIYYE